MRPLLAPAPRPEPLPAEAGQAGGPPTARPDVPAAPIALCVVSLACALQVNFGQFHPLALAWLTASLLGTVLCVAKPTSRLVGAIESRRTLVLGLALSVQFVLLLTSPPGATGALATESNLLPFRCAVIAAALTCATGLVLGSRGYRTTTAALLLLFALTGTWTLRSAPPPPIDVVTFQQDAARALLAGHNPYALTFADPYADSTPFYGPGLSIGGRLQFGFPYPPLGLLPVAASHVLLGDFRYAHLLAMTLAGALVAFARPGRPAFAAAALLLFTPRGFFVLEAGWTEPLAVLCLASVVFAACRSRRSVPVALGCLLAVKQYLVLAAVLAPLLPSWRKPHRPGLLWKTAAVAAAVTLPLALWDLGAFLHSVVLLQFRQPFREDALSYLVPLSRLLGATPPTWIAFPLAAGAAALALKRCPRTPAGFSLGLALVLLVFFAFNKQAFCNYYHLALAALCCAAGASASRPCRERGPGAAPCAVTRERR